MGQVIRSSNVTVIPKDGELEITLNINITIDGQVVATADNAKVAVSERKEVEATPMIPDFSSGFKLNFGKP